MSTRRLGAAAWLLLLAVSLWLYSLVSLRLPRQNDTLIHLRWAEQFVAALREGWLLPRWAHASIGGLGDPTFLYYQPLFYYITSAFSLAGLRAEHALLCAAMVPFLLLGLVLRFGILRAYPCRKAVLAASFVVACPALYFVAAYVGAFPWALSLPFSVLFAVESTREQPRPGRLAILLCLVCLSHLLSGLMTLASVGLARILFTSASPRGAAAHLRWGAGCALGLGLAGFFLYPAITQLHLINPDGWVQGVNYDWRRAFALPTITYFLHGFRWFTIQVPFALIALALCVLALSPAAGPADTPGKILAGRLAWIAAAALALGSELAYPLYAAIAPLRKLQFPYRFLFLALLLANLALVIQLNEGAWRHWRRPARAAALGLVLAQLAIQLHLQWDVVRRGEKLPAREVFMTGRFGQPEYIPAVRGDGWKRYLETGGFAGECARLGVACGDTVRGTHAFSTRVSSPSPAGIRLPLLAFPAWRVTVDGRPVPLRADAGTGLVRVDLGPGGHLVATSWSRMRAEVTGWWISALSGLLLAASWILERRRTSRRTAARLEADDDRPPGEPEAGNDKAAAFALER